MQSSTQQYSVSILKEVVYALQVLHDFFRPENIQAFLQHLLPKIDASFLPVL